LLLALRVFALVAASVALARPSWPVPPATDDATDARQVAILLDASASMSGFDSAQRAVDQLVPLVQELPAGAKLGLVVSARGAVSQLPMGTDRGAVLGALRGYAPTMAPGNHQPALREAAKMLDQPGGLLVLASDFQSGDWRISDPNPLPAETEIRFVQTAPEERGNAGIIAVDTVPLGAETRRIVVTVRNFASVPATRGVHIADASGEQVRTVKVPPLQNRRVAFVLQRQAGELTVRLDPDDYAADDTFHAWAGARPPLPVLAVTSPEQEPASQDAELFLRKALELRDERSPVQFKVDEVEDRFFFTRSLGDTRLIVVLGAGGDFHEAEFGKIQEFLNDGGMVLWTPGSSAPRVFQQLWRHGILRARFLEFVEGHGADTFGLGWVNPETPLGQVFARPETTDLYLFPVRQYVRFEVPDGATVWLRFLSGDPALVEAPAGRGRFFASALPLSASWSDFPLTQSFLPLVREIAQAAVPPGYGILDLECGSVPPGDETDNEPLDTSRPRALVRGEQPVQINVSRRESILDQVNLYDLSRQLTAGSDDASAGEGTGNTQLSSRDELWAWPAALAALLVLAELLLAHRLDQRELAGRPRTAQQES
jgi:hypothetical protein